MTMVRDKGVFHGESYDNIDFRDLQFGEKKKLLKEGFQLLSEEIPQSWLEDPNTCPCVIEGSCEGIRDPDYKGRCVEGTFGYWNCEVYQNWSNNQEPFVHKPGDQVLQDTTVMHGDEIVLRKEPEESVEERVNEGAPISLFCGLSKSLGHHSTGGYGDYRHPK